ncbi:MAG: pitrilysin family protein [Nannocystaceae bacterium]
MRARHTISLSLALAVTACAASTTRPDIAAPVAPPTGAATEEGGGNFPQEAYRQAQPTATTPRAFQLPAVQNFQLANGIDVYLIEKHNLPVISAELSFEGGEVNDTKGKFGLASVCMDMLTEGTKKLEKMAFAEALADTASSVFSYADDDTQGVAFRTLSAHLDATFGLFADTLRNPGLRSGDFKRVVELRLEGLKQSKGSAESVARRVSGSVLYGPDHPLGHVVTKKSLQRLRVSDCKRHHRSYVKPQGAKLFVVGDMTQAQVRERFEKGLAGWKGAPKGSIAMPAPKSRPGKVFFVNIPGAAQSAIRIAHFGPLRKAPDYFANSMMSAVLGGGFSGRVNMNLREDKGYSYGARGSFSYQRESGAFVASSAVRSDATYQSVLEIFTEISNMKSGAQPITQAELTREKNGAILGLPARFATAAQALRMYRELVYFGLPLDYWNRYVDNVSQVTLAQTTVSAATYLHPEIASVLVVGDANATMIRRGEDGKDVPLLDASGQPISLLTSLRNLARSGQIGAGEVVLLDADGNIRS